MTMLFLRKSSLHTPHPCTRVSQHCVSPSSSSGGTKQAGEARVGCVCTQCAVWQSAFPVAWNISGIKKRGENLILEIRKEPFQLKDCLQASFIQGVRPGRKPYRCSLVKEPLHCTRSAPRLHTNTGKASCCSFLKGKKKKIRQKNARLQGLFFCLFLPR